VAGRLLDEGILIAAICGATLGLANAGPAGQTPAYQSNESCSLKMFCPNYEVKLLVTNPQ